MAKAWETGLHNESAYDYIKRDIGDWPAFRWVDVGRANQGRCSRDSTGSFDWFIKSRSTQDLQRRAQTLLLCLMKEAPVLKEGKANGTTVKKAAPKVGWMGVGNGSHQPLMMRSLAEATH